MGKERADLGFGDDALEDFNPNDWNPDADKKANDSPSPEDTKKAAEAAGFASRESKTETPAQGQGAFRRRKPKTGRNMQFNMRAKPETIQAYYDIADANGWGVGETLEKAVELLEKEYGQSA